MSASTKPAARFRLPPVVFDALHLSALANGGIGCGEWYADCDYERPVCALGHAFYVEGPNCQEVSDGLFRAGITAHINDNALIDAETIGRIPFERWLDVVGVDIDEEASHDDA